MKYSKIKHAGAHPDRLSHDCGYPERIFAERWAEENKRSPGINGGYGCLELLMASNIRNMGTIFQEPIEQISQRDALVAATVIQWLGTNCGACFLHECEQDILKERKAEHEAFHKKYNLRVAGAIKEVNP